MLETYTMMMIDTNDTCKNAGYCVLIPDAVYSELVNVLGKCDFDLLVKVSLECPTISNIEKMETPKAAAAEL